LKLSFNGVLLARREAIDAAEAALVQRGTGRDGILLGVGAAT
jgi:hypothetical protein